ncbi:MAG: dTMP kinase [Lactobacillaceae bacterium]|jgi:dTMP kinase|nr:dTMP kinase [Lactobacillaceae bacterium]
MNKAFFLSIEGPDGAGKTTMLKQLLPKLEDKYGDDVVSVREPGGVRISEAIRNIVLGEGEHLYKEMDPRTEALLFAASRAQLIAQKIIPELKENHIVIADRYVDSSIAYQGGGRNLGISGIEEINKFATGGLTPDLTIYIDVPSEIGIARIMQNRAQEANRLDQDELDFHKKVRDTYLVLLKKYPNRIVKLDGTKNTKQLVQESLELIYKRIEEK